MIHSGNIDFVVTQDCSTNISKSLMSPANASNLGSHFENDLHVYRRFWLELFRSSFSRPHQQLLSIDCETHVTHWELQWKDRASLGYPWSDTQWMINTHPIPPKWATYASIDLCWWSCWISFESLAPQYHVHQPWMDLCFWSLFHCLIKNLDSPHPIIFHLESYLQ